MKLLARLANLFRRRRHTKTVAMELVQLLAERERELKLREQIIHAFTNALPDQLWAKDLNGCYVWANERHVAWLGADHYDEVIGKTDMYFAAKNRNGHEQGYHTFGEICANSDDVAIERGGPFFCREFGLVRGERCELAVHKAPIRDDQGRVIGVVGSGRDITDRIERRETIIRDFDNVIETNGCYDCSGILERLKTEIRSDVYDDRSERH